MLQFGTAPPPLILSAAADPLVENVVRYLLFPVLIRRAGVAGRGLAEIRRSHLEKVRLTDVMLAELHGMHGSYQRSLAAFVRAYDNGSATSHFATSIAADARYHPYVVSSDSTLSVFGADPHPAKTFNFMRSRTLIALCAYHDKTLLLKEHLNDVREDAFIDLPAARKLMALGAMIGVFAEIEDAYEPCVAALGRQHLHLTSRSWTWNILFPWRARLAGFREIGAEMNRRRRVRPPGAS